MRNNCLLHIFICICIYDISLHSIQTETTPLFSAVTSNSYELVEKLIDKGANIDASRVRNIWQVVYYSTLLH